MSRVASLYHAFHLLTCVSFPHLFSLTPPPSSEHSYLFAFSHYGAHFSSLVQYAEQPIPPVWRTATPPSNANRPTLRDAVEFLQQRQTSLESWIKDPRICSFCPRIVGGSGLTATYVGSESGTRVSYETVETIRQTSSTITRRCSQSVCGLCQSGSALALTSAGDPAIAGPRASMDSFSVLVEAARQEAPMSVPSTESYSNNSYDMDPRQSTNHEQIPHELQHESHATHPTYQPPPLYPTPRNCGTIVSIGNMRDIRSRDVDTHIILLFLDQPNWTNT